jgi:hypothetical protein
MAKLKFPSGFKKVEYTGITSNDKIRKVIDKIILQIAENDKSQDNVTAEFEIADDVIVFGISSKNEKNEDETFVFVSKGFYVTKL